MSAEDRESVDGAEERTCSECGHSEIRTIWENRPLHYGSGTDAVELSVRVPVRECCKCGYRYLDEEAEDLRHEAVCRHLGVLTPAEIKALRARFGWSQQDLAHLTDFGIATISRWERGALVPNRSNNKVLVALRDCSAFREYLQGLLAAKTSKSDPEPATGHGGRHRFRHDVKERPFYLNGVAGGDNVEASLRTSRPQPCPASLAD